MTIPESYPNNPPSVTFLTDMFHPLVDVQGNVSLSQRFPTWRPYQDYIFHVLHYLKNMFKRVVLDGLMDKHCNNKEAYRLYVEQQTHCSAANPNGNILQVSHRCKRLWQTCAAMRTIIHNRILHV